MTASHLVESEPAPSEVRLRIGTWNLRQRGGPERQDLIRQQQLDLLCAQEVTRSAYDELMASDLFGWGAFSLDHRPRLLRNSRSETLGCAVFGMSSIRLRSSSILPWLARPEKLVFADADVPGWRHPISVASYHASPGDGKPECSLQVAHWLELSFGPVLLGLDANSPEIDHPDHEQSRFYWQEPPFAHCEPALIGPPSKRRHGLEDVIRTWLAGRPDESAALRAARPNGPLAISYDRHPAANQHTWSRYDSIWATSEFGVQRVEYLWDEAMGAPGGGSDHAMVVADLTRPIRPPRPPGQAIIDYLVQYEVLPDGHLLVFADRLVDEPLAAANLQRWLTERPDRGSARWSNDRARPLRWEADGNTYTAIGLAQHICNEVGIELPRRRPGPHWWVDSPTGRNLVELSE